MRYFKAGKNQDSLTDVVYPTTCTWSYNEICSDKSGRAKSGSMNKRIIATKRKLECSWIMLTDEQASKLLKNIKAQTFIYLMFPDPFEGKDIVKRFYTDDVVAEEKLRMDEKEYIWNISFSFIEK